MSPSRVKVILQFGKGEDAGHIEFEKNFVSKRPHSMVHLTDKGQGAFDECRKSMRQVPDEPHANNF